MKLGDFDLSSPDTFSAGVPHDYFAFLRREAPISWQPTSGSNGFWSFTKYSDIEYIEKHPQLFSSKVYLGPSTVESPSQHLIEDHMLIMSDKPRHSFLRNMIVRSFSHKAISTLKQQILDLSCASIDAVIERGECDFVDVAACMPVEIISEIMALPPADRPELARWANQVFGAEDPDVSTHEKSTIAGQQMFAYAVKLGVSRRAHPGSDMFSSIAIAKDSEGNMLDDIDLGAFFYILATAGNETTRTQILDGLLTLIQNPQAAADLRQDPALLVNAVEEMLRFTSPVHGFARKVLQATEIRGQTFKAGDKVLMWYCSGNRDEEVFTDGNVFDIRRQNARQHLAFGARGSIHQCLGMLLARIELNVFFEHLLPRLPDIELNGPVRRLRSALTNGIKHMPVRFTPGKPIDPNHMLDLSKYSLHLRQN